MNVQTALATLLRNHDNNWENVAAALFDYACDTYVGVNPDTLEAMHVLVFNAYNSDEVESDPEIDPSALLELIAQYSADLAREFAYAAELCPLCFADTDVCADDEACPGA